MQNEMIERVARALARLRVERELGQFLRAHAGPGAEPTEAQIRRDVETAWPHHVDAARAAIEAMREPTEAMIQRGAAVGAWDECVDINGTENAAAYDVWETMIEAALTPP